MMQKKRCDDMPHSNRRVTRALLKRGIRKSGAFKSGKCLKYRTKKDDKTKDQGKVQLIKVTFEPAKRSTDKINKTVKTKKREKD